MTFYAGGRAISIRRPRRQNLPCESFGQSPNAKHGASIGRLFRSVGGFAKTKTAVWPSRTRPMTSAGRGSARKVRARSVVLIGQDPGLTAGIRFARSRIGNL